MGLGDLFDKNAMLSAVLKDLLTPDQRADLIKAVKSMSADRQREADALDAIATALKAIEMHLTAIAVFAAHSKRLTAENVKGGA